jgi:hypothetical protein
VPCDSATTASTTAAGEVERVLPDAPLLLDLRRRRGDFRSDADVGIDVLAGSRSYDLEKPDPLCATTLATPAGLMSCVAANDFAFGILAFFFRTDFFFSSAAYNVKKKKKKKKKKASHTRFFFFFFFRTTGLCALNMCRSSAPCDKKLLPQFGTSHDTKLTASKRNKTTDQQTRTGAQFWPATRPIILDNCDL